MERWIEFADGSDRRAGLPLSFVAVLVLLLPLAGCAGRTAPVTVAAAVAPVEVELDCPAVFSQLSPNTGSVTAATEIAACADLQTGASFPFRNLVFQSGGVKGVTYVGALAVLEARGILSEVERVAGTSAGAITATLVALGYSAAEIEQVMLAMDFESFEDSGRPGRLLRHYGWFAGDVALDFFRCLVRAKTGDAAATFADLARAGHLDLRVFATELTTGDAYEFSVSRTPDIEVARAVRMSMAIPLLFASVSDGDRLFVDGGLVRGYPIDTFDLETPDTEESNATTTLGFASYTEVAREPEPILHFRDYARALVEALHRAEVRLLQNHPVERPRTVFLDDLGVHAVEFEITDDRKRDLIRSGARGTCEYLRRWEEGHR